MHTDGPWCMLRVADALCRSVMHAAVCYAYCRSLTHTAGRRRMLQVADILQLTHSYCRALMYTAGHTCTSGRWHILQITDAYCRSLTGIGGRWCILLVVDTFNKLLITVWDRRGYWYLFQVDKVYCRWLLPTTAFITSACCRWLLHTTWYPLQTNNVSSQYLQSHQFKNNICLFYSQLESSKLIWLFIMT